MNMHQPTPATGIEARILARAKAARAACYGRPRIVNLARGNPQPKQPVIDGPLSFVKSLCVQRKITYEELTSSLARSDQDVEMRAEMMRAVVARYPNTTSTKLARIFKRDAATIRWALSRPPRKMPTAPEIEARDESALQLYNRDVSLRRIAEELGIGLNTVKAIRDRKGWPKRARVKPGQVGE